MTMSMMIKQEKDAEGTQKRGFAALGLLRRIVKESTYIEYLLNVWMKEQIVS